jgi:hypothetical protein
VSRNLLRAIKLREWVRRADDLDDICAMRELVRMADAACRRLNHVEFAAYAEWASHDPMLARPAS